jgi:hypothetical protein
MVLLMVSRMVVAAAVLLVLAHPGYVFGRGGNGRTGSLYTAAPEKETVEESPVR